MKITPDQSFHLTYCTNIHPGETWEKIQANLKQYIPSLKSQLSPDAPFGIGLRLSDQAARELRDKNKIKAFQNWLNQEDLYVFTLNGFPYGGFHQQVVKDQVYAPDWKMRSRFTYTLRLIKILAALLPEGIDGSISTLPLSYKPWWHNDPAARYAVFEESCLNLALIAQEMATICRETGKRLHVNLEPEPDGLLENSAEVINFFQEWLLPVGGKHLAMHQGISRASAEALLRQHIRICYDTCHFAVAYEDPKTVFHRFQKSGIQIGKIQLSAAVQVDISSIERATIKAELSPFAESTYLHQVIERWDDLILRHYHDLTEALPHLDQSLAQEWRIHFHVPIFIRNYGILQSTQDHLIETLALLQDNPLCNHLEIETYTWDVLPPQLKLDLTTSIKREYEWVLQQLSVNRLLSSIRHQSSGICYQSSTV